MFLDLSLSAIWIHLKKNEAVRDSLDNMDVPPEFESYSKCDKEIVITSQDNQIHGSNFKA